MKFKFYDGKATQRDQEKFQEINCFFSDLSRNFFLSIYFSKSIEYKLILVGDL